MAATLAVTAGTAAGATRTTEQIKFLVAQGCIPPLCALLEEQDTDIVEAVLEGLEKMFKVGTAEAKAQGLKENAYAAYVDETGRNKIEQLQEHENAGISEKAVMLRQLLAS